MKRFLIKLGVTLTILLALIGGNWYLFKNGWWENTLSTTVVPFQLLKTKDSKSLEGLAVRDGGNRSAEQLKSELSAFTGLFSPDKTDRPDLSGSGFTNSSLEQFQKILDPIYGVDNQYIGRASVSGLIQTNKGWNPILTLSVYNDTETVKNISYQVVKEDSGWTLGDKVAETSDDFAYPELDNKTNVSYLDLSLAQDDRFIKDKQWESSAGNYDQTVLSLLRGRYPNVVSRVLYFEYTATVRSERAFSTPGGIRYLIREQGLDEVNSPIFSLRAE